MLVEATLPPVGLTELMVVSGATGVGEGDGEGEGEGDGLGLGFGDGEPDGVGLGLGVGDGQGTLYWPSTIRRPATTLPFLALPSMRSSPRFRNTIIMRELIDMPPLRPIFLKFQRQC